MKKITALLAIAPLALTACGSSYSSNTSSSTAASSGGSKTTASSGGGGYGGAYGSSSSTNKSTSNSSSSGGGSNEVEMYDYAFKPKVITGKAGSTVKVELKNDGKVKHNFKIDGQKADADVPAGKDATVSVVIPKSGTVQFYCEYHKGLGMVGTVKAT